MNSYFIGKIEDGTIVILEDYVSVHGANNLGKVYKLLHSGMSMEELHKIVCDNCGGVEEDRKEDCKCME